MPLLGVIRNLLFAAVAAGGGSVEPPPDVEQARRAAFAAPGDLVTLLRFADASFLAGDAEGAVLLLAGMQAAHPREASIATALGVCQRRLGRNAEAAAALERALVSAPGSLRIWYELGLVARAAGRPRELAALSRARGLVPDSPEASFVRGLAAAHTYELDLALRELSRARKQRRGSEADLVQAEVEEGSGRFGSCVRTADAALRAEDSGDWLRVRLLVLRSTCELQLRRPEASEQSARDALSAATDAGDLDGRALALRALAWQMNGAGRRIEAVGPSREAASIHEALGEDAALSRDLHVLGYQPAHASVEAKTAILEAGIAAARRAGDLRSEARVRGHLGAHLTGAGQYQGGLSHLRRALDQAAQTGATLTEAAAAANLSATLRRLGDLRQAVAFQRVAIERYQAIGDARRVIWSRAELAELYAELGERGEARRQVAATWELVRSGSADGVSVHLQPLARAEALLGRRDRAIGLLDQALVAARGRRDRPAVDRLALARAELLILSGRAAEALAALDGLGADEVGGDAEGEVLYGAERARAEALASLGRQDEALDHARRALAWAETLRAEIAIASFRASYFARKRDAYGFTVGLLERRFAATGRSSDAREAFSVAERSRARVLVEALAGGLAPEAQRGDEARRISQAIGLLRTRLIADSLSGPERARVEAAILAHEDRLAAVETRLASPDERLPALASRPESPERIRAQLAPGALLLEVLLSEPSSYLFALDAAGALELHALAGRSRIERASEALRLALATPPRAGGSEDRVLDRARAVFDLILGPVSGRIASARHIVFVPDGILFHLPIEALADARGYLGARLEIRYSASASLLVAHADQAPLGPARTLVAFGDPILEPARGGVSGPAFLEGLERGGASLGPLPGSRREVEAIAALLGGGTRVLGADFVVPRVLEELRRPTRIVHFATHAILDETVPLRSSIVTSRAGGQGGALLQARDLRGVRIRAELVTLSACQSALGPVVGGEGALGLTWAFQQAGARSLLASLWPVSDHATERFMREFYAGLKGGQPKSQALLAARRAFHASGNPTLRHPYYWAAFVLSGSDRALGQ